MKLERFRVSNYRSVKDSGWIEVGGCTALVGGNESGKTNLLLALRALDGREPLSVNRNFPADRLRSEYSEELEVVRTVWSLSDAERAELAEVFPRAGQATRVEVGRGYEPERWVRFVDPAEAETPFQQGKELFDRVMQAVSETGASLDPAWTVALEALGSATSQAAESPREWAAGVTEALGGLQQPLQLGHVPFPEPARAALEELGDLAAQIVNESEYENAARSWVLKHLPRFVYLEEYPEIEGHQNLFEFRQRQRENRPEDGDEYFQMLLSVAGVDAAMLDELLQADPETRRQIASRAGTVLTGKLRELWSDRALKVRFNLDGEHWNTLVADPTSLYDVEVNLNERSRGFRWFFSFYVMFAASAKQEDPEDTVLLLDEPGLHLHAVGQKDLLQHLAALPNPVLFATQSPFLVPTDDLASVRTVRFAEQPGTTVSNALEGDAKTLVPVVHALVAEIAQGLLDGGPHLVVPEVTDFWYLRWVSDFLAEQGGPALPKELEITPAGGAIKIPYLVGLLARECPDFVVLMSGPKTPAGQGPGASSLVTAGNVVHFADGLAEAPACGADVEDLLDPEMYDRFVRFAYRRELKDRNLEPDASTPGMVRRYQEAFIRLGLEFCRARPARLILRGAAQNPSALIPNASRENFERLFGSIRARLEAVEG